MTHEYNIVVIHLRDLPAVSGRQWNGWHTAAMFTIYYPLSSLIMQLLSVCERTKTVGLQNILSLCPRYLHEEGFYRTVDDFRMRHGTHVPDTLQFKYSCMWQNI